jgi:hypothetical protein
MTIQRVMPGLPPTRKLPQNGCNVRIGDDSGVALTLHRCRREIRESQEICSVNGPKVIPEQQRSLDSCRYRSSPDASVLSAVNRLKDQGHHEHSDRDLCHTVDSVRLDHVKR